MRKDIIITVAAIIWILMHNLISSRMVWELVIAFVLLFQVACIFEKVTKLNECNDNDDNMKNVKCTLIDKSFSVVVILSWLVGDLLAIIAIPFLLNLFGIGFLFVAGVAFIFLAAVIIKLIIAINKK